MPDHATRDALMKSNFDLARIVVLVVNACALASCGSGQVSNVEKRAQSTHSSVLHTPIQPNLVIYLKEYYEKLEGSRLKNYIIDHIFEDGALEELTFRKDGTFRQEHDYAPYEEGAYRIKDDVVCLMYSKDTGTQPSKGCYAVLLSHDGVPFLTDMKSYRYGGGGYR